MIAQKVIVQKILSTMKFHQSILCQFDLAVKLCFIASEIEKKSTTHIRQRLIFYALGSFLINQKQIDGNYNSNGILLLIFMVAKNCQFRNKFFCHQISQIWNTRILNYKRIQANVNKIRRIKIWLIFFVELLIGPCGLRLVIFRFEEHVLIEDFLLGPWYNVHQNVLMSLEIQFIGIKSHTNTNKN